MQLKNKEMETNNENNIEANFFILSMVSYVVKTSKTQNIRKPNITSQNTCSKQENLFQINSDILFNPLGLLTQDVGT